MMGYLAGGWTNPSEKYESNWESSPNRGENKNIWNHNLVMYRDPNISIIMAYEPNL